MRRINHLIVLSGLIALAGCELAEAPDIGDACSGVEYIKDSKAGQICAITGTDESCRHFVEIMKLGKCPAEYPKCVKDSDAHKYCRVNCSEEGTVLCGEECINPQTNSLYCGANKNGNCNSSSEDSIHYQGENCDNKSSDTSRYTCQQGKCKKTDCEVGTHDDVDETGKLVCIKDSQEHCGFVNHSCKSDERCAAGSCIKDCGEQQILCDGGCHDPKHEPKYCGAILNEDGQCFVANPCQPGYTCHEGTCELFECVDENNNIIENEQICLIDDTKTCADIKSDINRCGDCNNKCETNAPLNGSADKCEAGVCQYKCNEGFTPCTAEGRLLCVNINTEHNFCGSCDNRCNENQVCNTGHCEDNKCDVNTQECYIGDRCVSEDPAACGRTCVNCLNTYNAASATCDTAGQCHVITCQAGYHLDGIAGSFSCVKNSTDSCGSTDAVNAVNCATILTHAKDVECSEGVCKVDLCESNYHVFNNTCEENTDSNCGTHNNSCTTAHGVSKCEDGTCVTKSCDTGFHMESNVCVGDSLEKCGGNNCKSIDGWKNGECRNGQCIVSECTENYHINGNSCELNSLDNCLAHGAKCEGSNVIQFICDNTKGCLVKECAMDYHITTNSQACAQNTNTNCGASNSTTTINCNSAGTGWNTGICNKGTCTLGTCKSDYYTYESRYCVKTSYYVLSRYLCDTSEYANKCSRGGDCTRCLDVSTFYTTCDIPAAPLLKSAPRDTKKPVTKFICNKTWCDNINNGTSGYMLSDITKQCYWNLN